MHIEPRIRGAINSLFRFAAGATAVPNLASVPGATSAGSEFVEYENHTKAEVGHGQPDVASRRPIIH